MRAFFSKKYKGQSAGLVVQTDEFEETVAGESKRYSRIWFYLLSARVLLNFAQYKNWTE